MANGINQVLVATCTNEYQETAANALLDRSLLFNRDTKELNIIGSHKVLPINAVDGTNIVKDNHNKITLSDEIQVKSITTTGNGPFNWKSQTPIATTSDGHYILLFFRQDIDSELGKAIIGGEIVEGGDGIYSHYQLSLASTGSRLLKGASTADKNAKLVLCKYSDGNYYYGIQFNSNIPATISFAGWTNIDTAIVAPDFSSYTDGDMSEVVELDNDSDSGTQVIDYTIITYSDKSWEFNTSDTTLSSEEPHKNYSLNNGLTIISSATIKYYPENSLGGNTGYIQFQNSGDDLSLIVLGPCTITVAGQSTKTDAARSVTITGTDDTVSGDFTVPNSSLSTLSYTKTSTGQETITISHSGGAIRYAYVTLTYTTTSTEGTTTGDTVSNYVEQLPITGEDGSPHIIRMSGEITRDDILKIAAAIRADSDKQVVLNLSECTMESAYTDWSADSTDSWTDSTTGASSCLSSAFYNCVGLRSFYYPKNVITSGGKTFLNCSFLREVHFNKEMTTLGMTGSAWSPVNNALFAGARLKSLFIPKNITTMKGYVFANSNIINVYFEADSKMTTTAWSGEWNTWQQTKEKIRFYQPAGANLTAWQSSNVGFGGTSESDGINFVGPKCTIGQHTLEWENYSLLEDPEEDIDYTA